MTRGRKLDQAVHRNYILTQRLADKIDGIDATTSFNKSEIVRDAIEVYDEDDLARVQELRALREENEHLKQRVSELEAQVEEEPEYQPAETYTATIPGTKQRGLWDRETNRLLAVQ